MGLIGSRHSFSDFHNEKAGNLLHWRIVENDHREKNDRPSFFVYRVVEVIGGGTISEYLHKDGQVDGACGCEGFFKDYAEVGLALILTQGREKAAGFSGFYTEPHRNWLNSKLPDINDTNEEITVAHWHVNTTEELKKILDSYCRAMDELSRPEFAGIKTDTKDLLRREIVAIERELQSREHQGP